TKVAKDFLAYAAYLEEKLDLIVERRKELKFLHRYDQIDRPLKHKCAHLYRICAARFKKMEYHNKEIAFLHNAKMRKLCSQAYTRLLQIYAHIPENHVRAARFEFFDNNSAENARTLILMGLRKFPQYIPLWVTHFKIELRYVARLLERREFLIRTDDRSSHLHSKNNEEIKKSFDPINTGDDEFLKLSLAKVVFEMAVKTIRERGQKAGLIRQFIKIAEDCGEFTKDLVLSMREYMSIYGLELEEEIDQMEVPNEELFEIDTKRMGIDEIKREEENIVKVERKSVLDGFNPDDPEIKKLLEKATLTEDYDSKPLDEVLKRSKTQEKKIRKSQNSKTAGESWFGLPASEMDEEKRRDLELIQMRNILDPKQHYKKSDRNVLPKYFQ
uniref:Fcf2 pre-rRNA processing C-terminal domain-containing protein n=1 Tax=Meloidogyne javanica TaxID=6303 RepID=A0A915LV27_MELJA